MLSKQEYTCPAGEFQEKNKYTELNETKLGYNTTITEYIGEFDIVLNSLSYNLYKSFNKDKWFNLSFLSLEHKNININSIDKQKKNCIAVL